MDGRWNVRYELYIDVFLFTSFCLDFEALFLADVLLKKEVKIRRLCGMAALSTICSAILCLWMHHYLWYLGILYVIVHPLLVFLTFREKRIGTFVRDVLVVYLVYFLLGGVMEWVHMSLFAGKNRMGAIFLVAGIGLLAACYLKWQMEVGMQIILVHLWIGDRELTLSAYHDTGNLLEDPYSHKPVHIIAERTVRPYLQEEKKHARLIPYTSLGQTDGLLEIYTLDKLVIDKRQKQIRIEHPVIGVAADALFSGSSYQMILNHRLQE